MTVLLAGGCDEVLVVLGSGSGAARTIITQHPWPDQVRERITIVEAPDWAEGMGASLRAGLVAARPTAAQAVILSLVDLPDVGAVVVRRLIDHDQSRAALARAVYHGEPGHPVLVGRDHLGPIASEVSGDQGARDYLDRHGADRVECGDLADGTDRDWLDAVDV